MGRKQTTRTAVQNPDPKALAMSGDATVLVVEDQVDVRDLYVEYLEEAGYRVLSAETGRDALSELDDSIDAVLLDRRLPDLSGPEVLREMRVRALDVRVAMVTAVEPDFDIVDMGFDLYLVKPLARESLLEAVETLLSRREYDVKLRRSAALVSMRATLETEKHERELAASPEYDGLVERIESLDTELDSLTRQFTVDDYKVVFRDIGRT